MDENCTFPTDSGMRQWLQASQAWENVLAGDLQQLNKIYTNIIIYADISRPFAACIAMMGWRQPSGMAAIYLAASPLIAKLSSRACRFP
jgi:hypothetical protein